MRIAPTKGEDHATLEIEDFGLKYAQLKLHHITIREREWYRAEPILLKPPRDRREIAHYFLTFSFAMMAAPKAPTSRGASV